MSATRIADPRDRVAFAPVNNTREAVAYVLAQVHASFWMSPYSDGCRLGSILVDQATYDMCDSVNSL